MSRSAGTLITTHNATYIPPRLMPGYKGHCPTTKFDYGETYGHATAKYFQDYRSATLNNSKSNYSTGGQFPTIYSHNPDLVMSARDRTRERYRTAPKYQLSNLQYDREEDLSKFDTLAQQHREHYKDRTGTMQRVDYFMLPVKAEEQFKKQSAYLFHFVILDQFILDLYTTVTLDQFILDQYTMVILDQFILDQYTIVILDWYTMVILDQVILDQYTMVMDQYTMVILDQYTMVILDRYTMVILDQVILDQYTMVMDQYTMVILDQYTIVIMDRYTMVILDTMDIYWTSTPW